MCTMGIAAPAARRPAAICSTQPGSALTRTSGPDARRGRPGALGPRRVVREELAVRLHVRAATRGVHDDRGVAPCEGVDVEARELARPLALTGVGVKSPAAGLLDRHRDRKPLAL